MCVGGIDTTGRKHLASAGFTQTRYLIGDWTDRGANFGRFTFDRVS